MHRRLQISSSAALLLLLGCATNSAPQVPDPLLVLEQSLSNAPPYTAVVTEHEAAIVLPIPDHSVWEWNLPETRGNAPEYRWEIGVSNEGESYEFGFTKYKYPGDGPERGSLGQLIQAGQQDLWHTQSDGGASVLRPAGIRVIALGPGSVLVKVEGRTNVQRLFSSRPRAATVRLVSPGEPEVERSINLTYPDEDASL